MHYKILTLTYQGERVRIVFDVTSANTLSYIVKYMSVLESFGYEVKCTDSGSTDRDLYDDQLEATRAEVICHYVRQILK